MNADIRTHVIAALTEVAPEVEAGSVDAQADLLEEYDLDSMDLLNFVTGLSQRLGVTIPERDYPQLRTLDGAVAYLTDHAPSTPA